MKHLIKPIDPKCIKVWEQFMSRSCISIDPYTNYGKADIKWQEIAFARLVNQDLYPGKVDNC